MAIPEQLGVSLTGQGGHKGQDSHISLFAVFKADRWEVLVSAMQTEKVKQGVGVIGQELQCHIGCPVEALLGEGLLRTAMSLCSGLVLRVRNRTTYHGCGLEGVGGHWLLTDFAL